ncbi:methyltransferase domain-containing protein [Mycolicibacterium vaccae]|uniref:methyltransferase domain-containing protein n=1 Tax=Mycolicibacterium vaccae TaxID=1810 RepID=UPI003D014958
MTTCRICGNELKHTFCDLGMSPMANSYLTATQLAEPEIYYPLHTYVCSECLLVQLPVYESPEEIFGEYLYFSSYSQYWLDHARDYVHAAIADFEMTERDQVVEIASNDGYLLQYFVSMGIPVLGVEPAANVAEVAMNKGIPTRVGFFGAEMAAQLVDEGVQADLLIGNNVFAHVPDLNDFVAGMATVLAPDGRVTLEFPHLYRLIRSNQFDTIYHEHFSYYSLLTATTALERHGLKVFDVEELPTHGGSLRIYACRSTSTRYEVSPRVADLRLREAAAGLHTLEGHLGYAMQVADVKQDLLEFLVHARRRGASVVAYGAPAKGNTLLNYCGIRQDLIEYTVDRSPHKQGHFLPGTHLPIYDPNRIRETRPDYVVILPWNLRDEIMREMAYVHDWGGQFVVPIPALEVIGSPR